MAAPMRSGIQILKTRRFSRLIPAKYPTCQPKIIMSASRGLSSSGKDLTSVEFGYLLRSNGLKIAYNRITGKAPGVVFCPGFQSVMGGVKALALEKYCQDRGHAYVRFDYQGCGQSEGNIRQATISDWISDVIAVLDELTEGPQVLVGSSMGGWLSTLAIKSRLERICGFIGVASAADFSLRFLKYLPEQMQNDIEKTGETQLNSEYGNYVLTKRFMDDLPQHRILRGPAIPAPFPVRLIHGMADRSVPYELSLKLAEKIDSPDVTVILSKLGDHRLSEPKDIELLLEQVEKIMRIFESATTSKL